MTNAIEQSKREMYDYLASVKSTTMKGFSPKYTIKGLESALESYLELLRQDLSALHETARKRFEDIQSLEAVNADLALKLSLMTTDRDSLRNRFQAYEERESQTSTSGQDSGDRASCAALDGKTAAILGAVVDCQRITTVWAMNDLKAKKAIRAISAVVNGSPHVLQAMKDFETIPGGDTYATWLINNDKCMHSFPSGEQCVFCGVGK